MTCQLNLTIFLGSIFMTTLGNRMKDLRLEHKLYQSDIAELLSVTLRQVQRYEKDESEISISKAIILADYYNVALDYLAGRSQERERR
jgi:transcriptional regulator with XRE-family HTH domain